MADTTRIVLVTGAGSGIGRAASQALLQAGFTVVLAGRRADALAETAALVPGATSLSVPTDITDPASVDALFETIKERFGRLDVLFNNAGQNVPSTSFGDLTDEQWHKVIGVNLTGSFLCARAAFRMMRDQSPRGGHIINNGSVSAETPRPGAAPYTVSKHAVSGLTKQISLDGRKFDIACGQLNVGNAGTEMTRRMRQGVPQADGSMAVEPVMDVNDVGRAVVFMANLPLDANVPTLTIVATKMPYVGRG